MEPTAAPEFKASNPKEAVLSRLGEFLRRTEDAIPEPLFDVLTQRLLPHMDFDETPAMNCSNQCVSLRWPWFFVTLVMIRGQRLFFLVDNPHVEGGENDLDRILEAWSAQKAIH